MRTALALLAATAAPASAEAPPEFGWTCTTRFELDGQTAYAWRDFEPDGAIRPYFIQTSRVPPHATYWQIDPRPEGPPPGEKSDWETGRSEAEVLRDGPDSVTIEYPALIAPKGPVYVYFWGDGHYAGAQVLHSAARVRRHTDRRGTMTGLISGLYHDQDAILRTLYPAQQWTLKVVDAAGREHYAETFRPPDLARSLAAWRQRRAEIEALEAAFRTDYTRKTNGTTTCTAREGSEVL